MTGIDQVQLNFNPAALVALNGVLAVIMFGVALDLRAADFRRVLRTPAAAAVGLACQFCIMPALAFVIVQALNPAPSIGLGILLVAACPGGNVSNFLTSLSGGNTALSVSLSGVSTLASVVMTPANFLFWGSRDPAMAALLQEIALSPADMVQTVAAILVAPTVAGMVLARWRPSWAAALRTPMRVASVVVLGGFVVGALMANREHFIAQVGVAFWIVALVNAAGLALGYAACRAVRLAHADARAVAFETGIQNSGFGLILCFNYFAGLGGMAIVAAWWGVWHLVSGLTLAGLWARLTRASAARAPA